MVDGKKGHRMGAMGVVASRGGPWGGSWGGRGAVGTFGLWRAMEGRGGHLGLWLWEALGGRRGRVGHGGQ